MAETLKRIAAVDFPAHFPQLMPLILTALHSNQPTAVEAGLIALRVLAKVYEFKGAALAARTLDCADHVLAVTALPSPQNHSVDLHFLHHHPRAALNFIVKETFPRLLHILRGLEDTIELHSRHVHAPSQHTPVPLSRDKAYEMQRTVGKIFWSFTQYDLPLLFVNDLGGVFSDWMNTFLTILRRPVKLSFSPNHPYLSDDDLRRMPEWKVKQWIGHAVYRLFQRYSNPNRLSQGLSRILDPDTMTKFGDFFRRSFAAPFTEAMLGILSVDRRCISPRVANLALLYLECAVTIGITYRVIKPKLAHLITEIIFPYLCISESDLALWAEDPVEYVRKTYDVLEDFNTPRAAACSLLSVMSRSRRSAVIAPLLSFLTQIMDSYAESRERLARAGGSDLQGQELHKTLAVQKDGSLLAFGTIREALVLGDSDANTGYLRAVLNSYVVEEFDSDVPFLRARVCWLYGVLTASGIIATDTVLPGLEGVQKCLGDKEFPVRVRAAVDIRYFLHNNIAANRIAPKLAELLTLLFNLLDDVDNTDIVATIDQVVVGFSDQVAPFARPLCERLVGMFSRAATGGENDDEAGYAAAQCLQALESIVCSVAQSPVQNKVQLLAEIEQIIAEIFDCMFEEDRIEHFEESLELLALFVYHSAMDRGSQWRDRVQSGVEAHEAFLSAIGGSARLCSVEVLKFDSNVVPAMQSDVASGGGIISSYLWSLFPKAMHAFHDWALDYSFHYLHLVDSYLSKAPRVFLCGRDGEQSYVQLLLGMISRLWDDSSLDNDEFALQGSRVCGLILQHCRNLEGASIDREIGVLTELVVQRLRSDSRSSKAVSSLLTSLAHLTYVSPMTTIAIIDKTVGCTQEVFSLWVSMVRQNQLERDYDRKSSAIALSAILGSDWSQLPAVLRQSIPQILVITVQLLESLAKSDSAQRHRIIIESNDPGVYGPANDTDLYAEGFSSGSDVEVDLPPESSLIGSGNTRSANETTEETPSFSVNGEMDSITDPEGDVSNEVEYEARYGEDFGEVGEEAEDGENSMFCVLQDVDELLYFESVVKQLSPPASQELMQALASDDTQRIQFTLNRAAELRTEMVDNVRITLFD